MEPLETERLVLRPFEPGDAPTLARLAGRREIADTTISIPHPYTVERAQEWIGQQLAGQPGARAFAITAKADGQLIGGVGIRDIDTEHSQAEMGIWISVENWGRGYATEAARAALRYGFEVLKINRIYAHHMVRNPASGRVLGKLGMRQEALMRQRVIKWGVCEDVVMMAMLREEWGA